MQLEVGQGTHTGMVRSGNEDSFFADPPAGLFVVADGMGGHAAGEIASDMAVRIVSDELRVVRDITSEDVPGKVSDALKRANQEIYERTLTEVDKQGMGTTASVLIVGQDRYLIGQVGDSRIYLLRDGKLTQLTKDHSYVQEQVDAGFLTPEQARYHPYSNVITRCVGAGSDVEPDTYRGELRRGDTFLVASDGLTGMVDDRRLHHLLSSRATAQRVVEALISEANGRGGLDNITAIVVRIVATDADVAAQKSEWLRRRSMADETVGSLAELYLGNLLYALELAALSLEQQEKPLDAAFYRGIARKLAEARGREVGTAAKR